MSLNQVRKVVGPLASVLPSLQASVGLRQEALSSSTFFAILLFCSSVCLETLRYLSSVLGMVRR